MDPMVQRAPPCHCLFPEIRTTAKARRGEATMSHEMSTIHARADNLPPEDSHLIQVDSAVDAVEHQEDG